MTTARRDHIFDADLELQDAVLIAASVVGKVDTVAQILDIGEGFVEGDVVVDATAVEVDTGDELYTILVQVSSKADFASDIHSVAFLPLGDAVPLAAAYLDDADKGAARYIIPVSNLVGDGTTKQYMRIYIKVAGTIATGVNFTAWLSKK